MKKYPTIIMLLAVLFTACSKNSNNANSQIVTAMVVDFDSEAPIEGAKVYFKKDFENPFDSAISDVSGRVSITMPAPNPSSFLHIYARKNGLLPLLFGLSIVPNQLGNNIHPFVVKLARPSFVNLIVYQQNAYQTSDTIIISSQNLYKNDMPQRGGYYDEVFRGKAISVDRNFQFQTVYQNPAPSNLPILLQGYTKTYFKYEILRGGSIISSNTDSTTLIQFGIRNFTLNY